MRHFSPRRRQSQVWALSSRVVPRFAWAGSRGQRKPSRRLEIRPSMMRAILERTSLSQQEFARLIGVSVKTLQNWEQDRRHPTGPAIALLKIIAHEPHLALKAIHQT
ncbi:MAG: helix-turn-helix domain-containing protein [Bryobacterales bacterium]|nr:helix-turn-helix domain-containing protein [Bryobacterales bacterium]